MKRGERWSPGVCAFYCGFAGGAFQLVSLYRMSAIMRGDILPSIEHILAGAAIGAAIGAVIAWVRNLVIP
jgi:hypothetical protein